MAKMPSVNEQQAVELSAAQRREVGAIKRQVLQAAQQFGQLRERLSTLAPRVVRLYNQIAADHDGFTFVEFCRLFDPSVPTHAADRDGATGYRNHRTYYTLDYMRRIVRQQGQQGRRGQQGVRDSATDALARTLATVLQIVSDHEAVWNAIQSEFAFSERLMTRLRKRVEETKPLIVLKATKPATVGNVIHMEPLRKPDENAAATTGEQIRQPGRRIRIPEPRTAARAA